MRRTIVSGCVAGVLSLVGLIAMAGPKAAADKSKATASGYGNADTISENELKIYDYFLASDQLEGRNFPSRGYDTAALYVASHLAEWGLKPMGSTSGTNGPLQPYLMPIELVARSVNAEQTKVSITLPQQAGRGRGGAGGGAGGGQGGARGGGANPQMVTAGFEYAKDFTVTAGGRGAPPLQPLEVSGNLVFAGNGYVINKTNTNPYEGLNVSGKIIVVAGLPQEIAAQQAAAAAGRGGGGGGAQNPLGEACKDFITPEQYGAKNGAVAVISLASYQQLTAMANPNGAGAFGGFGGGGGGGRGPALNGPAYQVVKFAQAGACPSVPSISAGIGLTNLIFAGEKVNAQQAFYGAGSNAKLDSFELNAQKTASIKIAVNSEAGHGENVVALLEGNDPVLKNEYVIMSAHLDHIGLSAPLPDGHNVNNGADDDGSGSTGLLAVAREYAEGAAKGMRPKRSVIFLWNGGEEKGLWGSQYFNMFPPVDLTKVVADLNMDMIGRTKNANSVDTDPSHRLVDPGNVMVVGPNISSDDLEKTIETVNNGYQKLGLDHFYDATAPDATHDNLGPGPQGQRIFYRSDHYNFAKMGVPIAFFTIGLHVDYHRPTDTPEKIDYHEIQVVSKTVAAVGWTLANQAGRPKLNSKLPDQLVRDMKTVQDQGWGKVTPVLAPLPGEPY
ncbi:MAG TPA: M28 family peptidase [Candidatus Acidoferrales bacterium]|nr:M28 family peptidase [Candidatus Acidoferrales bacterium]